MPRVTGRSRNTTKWTSDPDHDVVILGHSLPLLQNSSVATTNCAMHEPPATYTREELAGKVDLDLMEADTDW